MSYKNLYIPEKNYLERRNIETRIFDTNNQKEILVASAQVLQDMGYTITESEVDIGLITATKMREVGSTFGKATLSVLSALNGDKAVYEDKQKFYVSIVVSKQGKTQTKTRVTFARTVYDNLGNVTRIEKLDGQSLYTDFFDKLSQSIFLTANNI